MPRTVIQTSERSSRSRGQRRRLQAGYRRASGCSCYSPLTSRAIQGVACNGWEPRQTRKGRATSDMAKKYERYSVQHDSYPTSCCKHALGGTGMRQGSTLSADACASPMRDFLCAIVNDALAETGLGTASLRVVARHISDPRARVRWRTAKTGRRNLGRSHTTRCWMLIEQRRRTSIPPAALIAARIVRIGIGFIRGAV